MDIQEIESWDASYDGTQSLHRTDDGVEIYYEHRGEGPWLTILPSVFVVSTAWRHFTQSLLEKNTLLTYDIRNQGASSMGDGSYVNHVNDLKSLLDGLGIEQTYILGVSFSTLLARDFAVQNPERVKGLILCGPAISAYESNRRNYFIKAWLAALEAGGPGGLFAASYPFVIGDRTLARGGSAAYLALRERFLAVHSKAQLRTNLEGFLEADNDPAKLGALTCPVLQFTGDDDFSIGRAGMEDVAALIPDARVEVIERCGHAPYVERTDEFERIVREFIAEVESRNPSSTLV